MKAYLQFASGFVRLITFFVVAATPSLAATTFSQQIDPPEVNIGDQVVVTLTFQGGSITNVHLPPVDGLQLISNRSFTNITFSNGTLSKSVSLVFALIPSRAGDLVIPEFDVTTQEGEVLHVKAMKVHVLGDSAPATTNALAAPTPPPVSNQTPAVNPAYNPNGPVVMPPTNAVVAPQPPNLGSSSDPLDSTITPPMDSDGTPARVFMVITPQTTDAYVGQAIPMRIDFYLRMDAYADQNSLPTIKGSDFLMNSFETRGHVVMGIVENQQYARETWITAISAPKSGDYPLSMVRDTYWNKPITATQLNPLLGLFSRRSNLAHEPISSNQLTMHVHPLPTEGQPEHFGGAIGQFQVTGDAQPAMVAVGEPVTIYFSIGGVGNFDYVRCPAVASDPAWKSYVPSSKTNYLDESHTHAVKSFEQSIIPNKNGSVSLPAATFSYFDPEAKKYVIAPIPLPAIAVTGSAQAVAATSSEAGTASTPAVPPPSPLGFLPNRTEIGSLATSLAPAYRKPWFWWTEGILTSLPLLAALLVFIRMRAVPSQAHTERAQRLLSQQKEENAMAEAVRQGDAVAFFLAARHAVQMQLGSQWNLKPEALTLREIRGRDPKLAEELEPLFTQANEVIYSGNAASTLDLAQWQRHVHDLLHLQPA